VLDLGETWGLNGSECVVSGNDVPHIVDSTDTPIDPSPPFGAFRDAESYYATLAHELTHWTSIRSVLTVTSAARAGAMKVTAAKSLSLSWDLLSCVPISNCARGKKTPPISRLGWKF
jgi:hypothetical protein